MSFYIAPCSLAYGRRRLVDVRIRIFLVEVRRVGLAQQARLPRRRDLFPLQRFPVDSREKRMALDLLRVLRARAESQRGIADEESRDEVLRGGGKQILDESPPETRRKTAASR